MSCTPCGLLTAALLPLIPRTQGRVGRSDLSCFVLYLQYMTCVQFTQGRGGGSDLWCSVLGVQCVTRMPSVHATCLLLMVDVVLQRVASHHVCHT